MVWILNEIIVCQKYNRTRLFVIRAAFLNHKTAVYLFCQHKAHKLVRIGKLSETNRRVAF